MVRLFCIIFVLISGGAVFAGPLSVFAPASLQGVLDEVNAGFDGNVRVVYAGSSVLARQIMLGAPADVYISANPAWMDVLEQGGYLASGSRVDLLTNRLVVIGQGKKLSALGELPAALQGERLSVALTEAVPAGIYARQALENAGIWDDLKDRLAEADNVRSAAMLVQRGEVSFGIVYATDAARFEKTKISLEIPQSAHEQIVYPAAVLKDAEPGSVAYLSHLQSGTSQDLFRANGFGVPE